MLSPEGSTEYNRVNFRELHYGILPLGELLIQGVEVSGDAKTQAGLSQARAILEERGMVVLDAHLSAFDIIATGVLLTEQLNLEACVAPVSAYDYYFPLFRKGFFSRLERMNGVELYPVYRENDIHHWKRKLVYPSGLTSREKRQAVLSYYRRTLETIEKPHRIVIIAAYNGVNRMGEELASGVAKLLKEGAPGLCSLAAFDRDRRKFRVYFSESLVRFPKESTRAEMLESIFSEHQILIKRIQAEET